VCSRNVGSEINDNFTNANSVENFVSVKKQILEDEEGKDGEFSGK
jgi:hypothetical protein